MIFYSSQRFCIRDKHFNLTCKQIATLTLHPNVVLTARAERPRSLNNFEKDCVNVILGLSSATTMHVRTQDRLTPFIWEVGWKNQQHFKSEVNNSGNKLFSFAEQMAFKNTRVTDMNWLNNIDMDCTQFGSIHTGQPTKIVPRSFVAGFDAQDANYSRCVAATQPLIILSWKNHKMSFCHRVGSQETGSLPVLRSSDASRVFETLLALISVNVNL